MHIVLFVLGVVTAVAGFLAILYGIPVNEFSFGNTLIIAGTVAVIGGFLLIGIAAVVRQLKRLAESAPLHRAPMPFPFPSAEPLRPAAQAGFQAGQFVAPAPAHTPPKLDPIPRMPAPSEPQHPLAPSTVTEPPEWLRPKDKTPNLADQSLIEEIEASLSPQSTLRPVSPPSPLKVYDQSFDPRVPMQARANEPAAQTEQAPRPESVARPAPPVEHAAPSGLFDTVWPEIRPGRHPETVARARKPDVPGPVAPVAPVASATPPRSEAAQRDQVKPAKDVARESQSAAPEEPRVVAILKSGMIDGMAYTLYADGSIEAVLATGTVRFASIDALRFHLEQNS
jgi:hypothetical protein